jgi:hypothetical protein
MRLKGAALPAPLRPQSQVALSHSIMSLAVSLALFPVAVMMLADFIEA